MYGTEPFTLPGMEDLTAVLCQHVFSGTLPILYAIRYPPTNLTESGWQFSCNSGRNETKGEVCLLKNVLLLEPALAEILDSPPDTIFYRMSAGGEWESLDFNPFEEGDEEEEEEEEE